MSFWIFMLVMDLLVPLTMIGFGRYFLKKAPKEINSVFGYRTAMSMKNRDTWEFAHRHMGKIWCIYGAVLLPVSALPMLFVVGRGEDMVGTVGGIVCAVQVVILIASIFPTGMALKRNFDENGNRR